MCINMFTDRIKGLVICASSFLVVVVHIDTSIEEGRNTVVLTKITTKRLARKLLAKLASISICCVNTLYKVCVISASFE